jgi:hypothetical protein
MNVCGFQIIYLDTVVSRGLRLTVVSSAGPEAPKKLDTVVSRDLRLTVILSAGPEAPKKLDTVVSNSFGLCGPNSWA